MKYSSREFRRLCVIIQERFLNPATLVGGSISYFHGEAIMDSHNPFDIRQKKIQTISNKVDKKVVRKTLTTCIKKIPNLFKYEVFFRII